MNILLAGGKHFGCITLHLLLSKSNINVVTVVVTDSNDRLRNLAVNLGLHCIVSVNPKIIDADLVPDNCDLIVTAYSHAKISDAALEKSKLGGIGYHPSLLPRHRGKRAVEQTIEFNDKIAGGTVYQLSSNWDEGNVVAQEWCWVNPDDTAETLWRRELSPIGIKLLSSVIDNVNKQRKIISTPQQII